MFCALYPVLTYICDLLICYEPDRWLKTSSRALLMVPILRLVIKGNWALLFGPLNCGSPWRSPGRQSQDPPELSSSDSLLSYGLFFFDGIYCNYLNHVIVFIFYIFDEFTCINYCYCK